MKTATIIIKKTTTARRAYAFITVIINNCLISQSTAFAGGANYDRHAFAIAAALDKMQDINAVKIFINDSNIKAQKNSNYYALIDLLYKKYWNSYRYFDEKNNEIMTFNLTSSEI